MRRTLAANIVVMLLVAGMAGQAIAQNTTGIIDGVVSDPNGEPLPGVTVVANSPALIQADLTAVTSAAGYFRLNLLPPGVYVVSFQLPGFRRLDQSEIVVSVGQDLRMDVALQLAPIAATETVVSEVPNIDPRAAKLAFNYTGELAANIPTARNMDDLFSTIPGVESVNNLGGGIQPGTTEVQNVLGAGERSSQYRLDGANTTDPAGQWNTQSLMPYDIVEEIQVVKAAKPAEIPFQGGLFNVVTKSGGNDFSGQAAAYFADDSLQSTNTGDLDGPTDSNALVREYELTASLGGRIVRDKLWWFASGRYYSGTSSIFGFPADVSEDVNAFSGKLTFQPTEAHRITATGTMWQQDVSHYFFGYSPALALDEEASSVRPRDGATVGARWSGMFSDQLVAEASVNYTAHNFDQGLQPNGSTAIVDLATGKRARSQGVSAGSLRDQDDDLWNVNGSLSWYVPDAAGQHDVKFGVEYMPTRAQIGFGEPGDHQLHTLFGNKFAVRFLNTPTTAIWDNDLFSLYAQDSWSLSNRITINFGLRYMHTDASSPEQVAGGGAFADTALVPRFPELARTTLPAVDLVTWDTIEPRLAVSFQLDRSGRTMLRAGASRYYQNLESYGLFTLTPAFPVTWVTRWNDRNNDNAYQVGEEGALLFSFGGQLNQVDPDIRRPYTDELVLGISHEPVRNLQLSANAIYRKDRDLTATIDVGVPFSTYTPVPYRDPGPDGIPGTGDDATLTVYARDPATIGKSRLQLTNPEGNERTYKGLELTASKRFSHSWQMVASLVLSEMQVVKPTVALSATGLYDTPNGLINAEGLDPVNQTLQVKLQGTYQFGFGLGVSGLYRFRTGNPYTRELVVTGLPQGPFNVRAESQGASRTDNVSILDLRLEQGFDTAAGRVGVILDVFNLFNAAPVVDAGRITGVDYGEPRSIQTPRVARLGLRYTW